MTMKKPVSKGPEAKTQQLHLHHFQSPLGKIELAQTDRGVCRISVAGERGNFAAELIESLRGDFELRSGGVENRKAAGQLKEYFAGKRKKFDFKLDLQTSDFKRKALIKGVMKIPYGQTRSYSDVARSIGSPLACRAVGNANATNPLPLVIPCHRVVAAHGIGGYGGGLDLKRKLLALEAKHTRAIKKSS